MRELGISYGRSCHAKMWTNDTISFETLIDRLRDPVRTPETVEEYRKLKGDAKQKAKDKGGFVGGILKDGKRNGANVLSRSSTNAKGDTKPLLSKRGAVIQGAAPYFPAQRTDKPEIIPVTYLQIR